MRTKVYKTVHGMSKQTTQLTAQEIINGSFHHNKNGWTNCKLTDMDQFYTDITNIIGGNKRNVIRYKLQIKPNHWALKRIIYNNGRWGYCAGQDYTAELSTLRKYLYNL